MDSLSGAAKPNWHYLKIMQEKGATVQPNKQTDPYGMSPESSVKPKSTRLSVKMGKLKYASPDADNYSPKKKV